ncbi:MAG: transposase [Anaerolineae bacterium]|nr:transposase [Anaerolineae bacterium]
MTAQIRQLNLSLEDKKALKARYEETNNRRWQERIQYVLLKGQALTLEAISEVVPYNINTISDWIRRYAEQGLEGICVWEYQGSHAHLTQAQQQSLKVQVTETSSPNLNLIERVWGFMKDHLLRTYYPTFSDFKHAISHFFKSLDQYADVLQTLMTENFQILNSV